MKKQATLVVSLAVTFSTACPDDEKYPCTGMETEEACYLVDNMIDCAQFDDMCMWKEGEGCVVDNALQADRDSSKRLDTEAGSFCKWLETVGECMAFPDQCDWIRERCSKVGGRIATPVIETESSVGLDLDDESDLGYVAPPWPEEGKSAERYEKGFIAPPWPEDSPAERVESELKLGYQAPPGPGMIVGEKGAVVDMMVAQTRKLGIVAPIPHFKVIESFDIDDDSDEYEPRSQDFGKEVRRMMDLWEEYSCPECERAKSMDDAIDIPLGMRPPALQPGDSSSFSGTLYQK